MYQPESFLFEIDDKGVALITLNRPDRLNALTFQVYRELTDLFQALDKDERVRCVVITGQGRGFCSGGDVEDIIGALFSRDVAGLLDFTRMTCDLIRNMRALRRPIIAALNGTVAGAGAAIALASDMRVASEKAKIAFLFTKVGLSGADMGACYLLPRVVGVAKASEMLMTGDFISAQEAQEYGLYNHVVPTEAVLEKAMALAHKLASGPAFGLMFTKRLINRGMGLDLSSAMDAEEEVQSLCMLHPDFREAYEAFVEKRDKNFKGTTRSA